MQLPVLGWPICVTNQILVSDGQPDSTHTVDCCSAHLQMHLQSHMTSIDTRTISSTYNTIIII